MHTSVRGPLVLASLALFATALAGCTAVTSSGAASPTPIASLTADEAPTSVPLPSSAPEAESPVAAQLAYLIEEEKLAHDVYVTLGDIWGARIFDSIAASENAHQEQVAALLVAYSVADPRADAVGVFTDPALQSLYDDLIAKGSQSLADAVQVGVTIEQTDITDLSEAIAAAPADVVTVLQRLLAGSQNHLAAFERQA